MKTLLATLLLLTLNVFAGTALETNTFKDIDKMASKLAKKYGAKNVLIVLDIDNTVLKMKSNIGSDQWFNWQSKNCLGKKSPDFCAAKTFDGLLYAQGVLFEILPMMPTEEITPKIVNKLQKNSHPLFLLTSRGTSYRAGTQRELKKNGYKIKNYIGPKHGYPSTYKPFDVKNPKKYNLTKEDIIIAKLKNARSISYMDGVMMTSGMNKGIMLKTILNKTGINPKAIIFVDDHLKHTVRVQAIMGNMKGLEMVTFRYGAVDKDVKAFKKSNKALEIKQYKLLDTAINSMVK